MLRPSSLRPCMLFQNENFWSHLFQNDQVWSSLIHSDPVWSGLIKFDQVWSSLIKSDQVWSTLIQFDPHDPKEHDYSKIFIIVQKNNKKSNNKVTLRTLEVNSRGQKDDEEGGGGQKLTILRRHSLWTAPYDKYEKLNFAFILYFLTFMFTYKQSNFETSKLLNCHV